jgi:hypothetical protein
MCDANEDAHSCVLAWAKAEGVAQRKNLTLASILKSWKEAKP